MNRVTQFFRGYAEILLEAAEPERCLNRLAAEGIFVRDVRKRSSFSAVIRVSYLEKNKAVNLIQMTQGEASVQAEYRGVFALQDAGKRPVLAAGILLAIFALLVLPKYVWVITVQGNEALSEQEILRAAEECGVMFGAKNSELDSQRIKNRMLQKLDALQWAAVNCSGGLCEIRVKERTPMPHVLDHKLITDVVAGKGGTITEVRVLEGTALCEAGDTVEAGQLLVSGILDPSVHLRTVHAQAEIYAVTNHESAAAMPEYHTVRTEETSRHAAHFIRFGRFRIKISGNSSNCTAGCDKMISRHTMTLPGGYVLPLEWITETCIHAACSDETLSEEEAAAVLEPWLDRSVLSRTVGGKILSVKRDMEISENRILCSARYTCSEMIAREQGVNLFGSEQYYGRTNSERGTD